MKRVLSIIICLFVLLSICACNSSSDNNKDDGRLKVVCTIFPQYDFVRQVAGDLVDVKLLVAPEADVHGYEPSLSDLKSVHECDLFIYSSGESESWATDMLDSVGGTALDICKGIELLLENEPHEHEDEHHFDEHATYDEHVWTSPVNAKIIVKSITDELCKLDSSNSDTYTANSGKYIEELVKLDGRFRKLFDSADNFTLIVADRFPFRYFAEEYGVDYFAAFSGCSSETEPTLSTYNELIKTVENSNVKTVFYVEMSDQKTADVVCGETGCDKRLLHSCHNLSKEEFESGYTYLKLMNRNADTIEEVLNK